MAYYVGIALVSGATLLLEIALLRLFAVQQFYHFAFMAISLALLGAGASGSLLSVRQGRYPASATSLATGVTMLASYLVINYLPFDSFSIAWDRKQILYLILYFTAVTTPFFFSGLLIGGELMAAGKGNSAGSHRVYAVNLVGSSVGSISSLLFLPLLGGERTVVFSALLCAAAAVIFLLRDEPLGPGSRISSRSRRVLPQMILALALILAGSIAIYRFPGFLQQRLSPYKSLSILERTIDFKHLYTAWDVKSRVDTVESSTIHVMPGLSLFSSVGPPPQAGLLLDGDSLMPISGIGPDSEEAALLADQVPAGLVYRLRPGGRTLVIEAATGMDVLLALASGAEQVTAVEDNRLIIEAIQGEFQDFAARLYSDPRVSVINQAGRIFVRQPDRPRFDIVILALTDPHRSITSGAYSLTENYTYTIEAISDYLGALDENGLLFMTRWLQTPPSESGRAFGMVAAALKESGRSPSTHLIAFRTLRTMTILASMQPWSDPELSIVRSFLSQKGFDAVYLPGILPGELNRFNVLEEPIYHQLFTNILADPSATYRDYQFDIRPPTDDRPFFFHFFKWRQTPEILASLGLTWQPFGGSGFFVLIALLLLVGVMSLAFIVSPLLLNRASTKALRGTLDGQGQLKIFLFYAALGLGFLFVEIPLAQRFILVLDEPVTALSVVVFAILLFSGLGSLTARRWRLRHALPALIILVAFFPLLLSPLSMMALRWPAAGRLAFAVTFLAPLGYLMGIPFAAGLRLVEERAPTLVPWAWAVNGCFSVMSAVLAVITAFSWGFSTVLWLGAAAYGLAWFAFRNEFRADATTASVPLALEGRN